MRQATIQRPRSVFEVFKMLPEGTLAEVIDNALYMSPAPTPAHQKISIVLSSAIFRHVEKNPCGEVYYAPLDVFLDETSNVVQPDLVFFFKDSGIKIDNDGLHGVPDMIIEILSPGNVKHDLVTKKNIYEKSGVREYWVIDPESRVARGFSLKGTSYISLGEIEKEVRSSLLQQVFPF